MRKKKNLAFLYEEKIHQVVEILKKTNPEKIILFGSVASGKIHPDSDIDMCVIKKGDRVALKRKIWDLLWRADYNWQPEVEVHVYPPDVYQDWLSRNDPFLGEIEKGKVLYER